MTHEDVTLKPGPKKSRLGLSGKVFLKGFILIATLIAAGALLKVTGLADHVQDTVWIDTWVRGQGIAGEFIFVGLMSVLLALGVPRQAICFVGGYALGFWEGLVLCLLASLIGCLLNFYYARFLGRSMVRARLAERLRRLDGFWQRNPFTITLMIRLLPIGSNLITNLLAGVSSVAALPFFAGSFLGYIPQSVVFVLLGTGVGLDAMMQVALSVVLFVISAGMGLVLFRRFRAARHLESAGILADEEED